MAGTFHKACEFSLSAAECDRALGSGPMFEGMRAQDDRPARGRPSSSNASRKVCIDVGCEFRGCRLKVEVVNESMLVDQVPDKSLEGSECSSRRSREEPAELLGREGDVWPVEGEIVRPRRKGPILGCIFAL